MILKASSHETFLALAVVMSVPLILGMIVSVTSSCGALLNRVDADVRDRLIAEYGECYDYDHPLGALGIGRQNQDLTNAIWDYIEISRKSDKNHRRDFVQSLVDNRP